MSSQRTPGMMSYAWTGSKGGKPPDENEDAYRVAACCENGKESLIVALSDGATEAVFAKRWANVLVDAVESDWPMLGTEKLNDRLNSVRQSYSAQIETNQLPWFVRNKFLMQGSQATLLACTLFAVPGSEALTVDATVVGDTAFILFRAGGRIHPFPHCRAEDFNTSPNLVTSIPQTSLHSRRCSAHMQPGDLFMACTDAVAKWTLECLEAGQGERLFQNLGRLLPVPSELEPFAEAPDTQEAQCGTLVPSRQWVNRLWDWVRGSRHQTVVPTGCREVAAEIVNNLEDVWSFDQFIGEARNGKIPQMRNDDSTIVLVFPCAPDDIDQRGGCHRTIKCLRQQTFQVESLEATS